MASCSRARVMVRASTATRANSATEAPVSPAAGGPWPLAELRLVEGIADDLGDLLVGDGPDGQDERHRHGRDQDPAGHVAPIARVVVVPPAPCLREAEPRDG